MIIFQGSRPTKFSRTEDTEGERERGRVKVVKGRGEEEGLRVDIREFPSSPRDGDSDDVIIPNDAALCAWRVPPGVAGGGRPFRRS